MTEKKEQETNISALTNSQQEAVSHGSGPMMVLAGPGSGKTMVITRRIGELIRRGISPSHILVVTFTRAAARQMEERFARMAGNRGNGRVTFATFHSIFFKIIQYAYGYQASSIIREEQKTAFFRELIRRSGLDIQDEGEFITGIIGEISMVKGERIDLAHYYSANCPEEVFQQLYRGYEQMLRENRLIDFDDMQVYCYELFQERKDILSAWQRKYPYILVDEFQDICRIQYDILKLLAGPGGNLFIVGDDDQSIYRFRGAKPEIMLGFEKDFPGTKKVLLDQNFRCDGTIVEASLRLIGHNQVRFPKKIQAARPSHPQRVITRTFPTAADQNRQIARELRERLNQGEDLRDTAVLFRTNRNAGALVRQLMAYNVPFDLKDAGMNLYDHWIAKDLITYIRIAMGDRSREAFLRIINRPNRYISRSVFTESQVSFEQLYQYYAGKDWIADRVERLEYDVMILGKMAPYAAIQYIRKAMGYEIYLEEYAKYRRMKPAELTEILDELHENAKDFKNAQEWFDYIERYAKELKAQRSRDQEPSGAALMTMHGAKGLEYTNVYIADASEGVIPHKKAASAPELEEERRLFYVAMTRAKERLYICCPLERYGQKQEISRFVEEYTNEHHGRAETGISFFQRTGRKDSGAGGQRAERRRF